MVNFDGITRENIKKYNPAWWQICDHPYRILIIWVSGSRKDLSYICLKWSKIPNVNSQTRKLRHEAL